jgi:hypothetical protein
MHYGQHVGVDRAGQDIGDGMVSRGGRWYSFDWWYGHHDDRDACGAYRPNGSPADTCRRRNGHRGGHRFGPKADKSLFSRKSIYAPSRATEGYADYLEYRLDQADRATNGIMLSERGKRAGISSRKAWFSGAGQTSSKNMSEELRDWFAANGPNLSAKEFKAGGRTIGGRR